MDVDLDDVDRAILRALMDDARTPFSEVARRIDMSSATVHDRVDRMEDAGVLEGYHAAVDPAAVGLEVTALVGLDLARDRVAAAVDALADVEGVQTVHLTAGRYDAVARVVAADTPALQALLVESVGGVDGVTDSETLLVLDTPHDGAELPL
jgi:Lrp/AsnC family transcriptional regulator for asnA, asnC and gidA